MMECLQHGSPLPFRVTARPGPGVRWPGLRVALAVLLPWFAAAGTFFALHGAWPIVAWMAAALAGLVAAFLHLKRHAGDFERLTLDADRLVVDSHAPGDDRHTEFNSHWVSAALRRVDAAGTRRLVLRAEGKEVAFGRLLSDAELAIVGRELGRRLARLRQWGGR
ncbi:DUF2244 domain-containing protein [Azospira restricta]|uniref:DUF2244 domain-containing protein n=1 Tax=Azospira restricta TaxID=404405 RepID=A0A974PXA2_9RHOO|nr:DUF2244 domain-containing protein [Azospira restricta]QRJ63179.1 DUF2244 domain-containing protein [Azospira restricta]